MSDFDYSDDEMWVSDVINYKNSIRRSLDAGTTSEEELLADFNEFPRRIGYLTDLLSEMKKFIYEELLVPSNISLQDRTDSWIADRRDAIGKEISKLKRQDEELKAERDDLDQELRRRFDERGTTGTQTKNFTISLKEDDNYPETYDRTSFEEYVLSTGKIHLLQKRLSMASVQEELMALREEHETLLKELEVSGESDETAVAIYKKVFGESELLTAKINVLKLTGTLVPTLKQELADYFSIPGVHIVTKYSITSKKRSSK